ncbi:hypothetical protein BU17DRAFT_50600, partial [Hysterangium stoloniferum]
MANPSTRPHSFSASSASNPNNGSGFNPHQVALDIRTPEDLALVNSFLVALGRDVNNSAA